MYRQTALNACLAFYHLGIVVFLLVLSLIEDTEDMQVTHHQFEIPLSHNVALVCFRLVMLNATVSQHNFCGISFVTTEKQGDRQFTIRRPGRVMFQWNRVKRPLP